MIDAEKKFSELRQQVDQFDATSAHSRIESRLKTAWQHSPAQNKTAKWNWPIWSYALSASGVAALALVTTLVVKPTLPASVVSTQKSEADYDSSLSVGSAGLQADAISTSNFPLQILGNSLQVDEYEVPQEQQRYSFGEEGAEAQLFQESVSLSLDVKDDMLEVIHQLREQIESQQGYLVNIYYYDTQGTVDIQLPADQLTSFEEFLKKLDVNHELEIGNYNVVNVSQQVVLIDENIKAAQKRIDEGKVKLSVGNLTENQRQEIQEQITADEDYLKLQTEERSEKIAEYDLVSVSVVLNEYSSFWEGNYTQYDRSTFGGMIQYELSKALYTLIRSSSSVIRFVVWLVVYSILFVPAFLVIRRLIRVLVRKIKTAISNSA